MRAAIILPVLLLGACQVSKDDANDSVTVAYNQDVAENAAADVANTAGNIAEDIANDVEETGERVQNEVGDDDRGNAAANSN